VRLAEERGQVGGQGVDEVLLLAVLVALDAVEVVAEALQAARAQAPRQAAVDHVALVRAEADPGAGVDHPAHALEVALLEREGALAAGHGLAQHLSHGRAPPRAPAARRATRSGRRASGRTPAAAAPWNTGIPGLRGSRTRAAGRPGRPIPRPRRSLPCRSSSRSG